MDSCEKTSSALAGSPYSTSRQKSVEERGRASKSKIDACNVELSLLQWTIRWEKLMTSMQDSSVGPPKASRQSAVQSSGSASRRSI